jgi:hypothetical protein
MVALAGASFQLAVYESVGGYPKGLPMRVTTSMAASVVGNVSSTSVGPLDLQAGLVYFLAVNASASGVCFNGLQRQNLYNYNLGGGPPNLPVTSMGTNYNYTIQHPFGSWPDMGGVTSFGVFIGEAYVPVPWFTWGSLV